MGNEKFCDMCGRLIEKGENYKIIGSQHIVESYEIEIELNNERPKVFCSWKCVNLYAMYKLRSSLIREVRKDGHRRLGVFFTCEGQDIPLEWVEQVKLSGTGKYRIKKGFFLNLLENEIK